MVTGTWAPCVCCGEAEVFDGMRCIACQVTCDGTECEVKNHIVMVFRTCEECGHAIACLANSDKRPESCEEHN